MPVMHPDGHKPPNAVNILKAIDYNNTPITQELLQQNERLKSQLKKTIDKTVVARSPTAEETKRFTVY